jgi:hypothetical protein
MPLSFGLWYDFRNPERWRQSWPRLYQETIEQAACVGDHVIPHL